MSKKKYIISFSLILGLTAFALWFALKDNFSGVMHILHGMPWYFLIFILLYGLAYNITIACIYYVIVKKKKPDYTFKESLAVAFVGAFFSGITPSSTGGQVGQAYILKNQGIKYSTGASMLWLDFIVYQSVMVIYTTIIMIFQYSYYQQHYSSFFVLVLIGWVINTGVILFLITMAKFPNLYQKISKVCIKILNKIKIIKNPEKIMAACDEQILCFNQEIHILKEEKMMVLKVALLNVLRLTILYTLPLFIAFCLGLNASFSQLWDVITMSAFVMIANSFFPVPGASGGTEAAFILIFSFLYGRTQTSSIMILWRFASYHIVILIGGLTFLYCQSKYNKRKLANGEEVEKLCE